MDRTRFKYILLLISSMTLNTLLISEFKVTSWTKLGLALSCLGGLLEDETLTYAKGRAQDTRHSLYWWEVLTRLCRVCP